MKKAIAMFSIAAITMSFCVVTVGCGGGGGEVTAPKKSATQPQDVFESKGHGTEARPAE